MLATDMLGHLALQKCCCTVLVAYAQGYPNTHNLDRVQDFGPIWIRIRIQGYTINFERKNSK